ncbi:MAG: non-ribosomal peptide synthetase [Proteobacteria bacterium]|nr:non-ribosomal peptide synthetase [Pseudomonadota bacterium]
MNSDMNLTGATLDTLLAAAARGSEAVHYIGSDGTETRVPYAELRTRALGVLGFLQRKGVARGDSLVLMVDDLAPFVDAFWACVLGGIVVVPLASPATDEQRLKALRVVGKLDAPWLLLERKALARLGGYARDNGDAALAERFAARALCLDEITSLARAGAPATLAPDDLAFIQFSSGSTGEPKGVQLSHRNLATNIAAILAGIGGAGRDDSSLSWMPLTHDMGLIGFHLTPIAAGASHWLMPPALFVRRPLTWLRKIAEHRVSVSCSPNFGYRHVIANVDDADLAALDLASLRVLFNGAEPIAAGVCRTFVERLAPAKLAADVMLPVYGLAEASLAVTFPPLRRRLATTALARDALGPGNVVRAPREGEAGVEHVKVGTPVAGCSLRIADARGDACADGIVGRVLICGDNVTRGYYGDPALTARTIVDGWLDTGDLGVIVDGELVITGRAKEVVYIAGRNHYPPDLEAILERDAGIEPGRAAIVGVRASDCVSDELVAFVVHKGNDMQAFVTTAAAVQRTLAEQAGVALRAVVPLRTLPKTTSGKLQRVALADEFARGVHDATLAELATLGARPDGASPAAQLEDELLAICRAQIPGRPLAIDDNLFEIGTSSLTLARIYERVDAAYPGMLEVTDFFDYPTVKSMAAFLRQRMTARDAATAP